MASAEISVTLPAPAVTLLVRDKVPEVVVVSVTSPLFVVIPFTPTQHRVASAQQAFTTGFTTAASIMAALLAITAPVVTIRLRRVGVSAGVP